MPAGELKHGTLALIEEGTPVVAICPKDYTFDETLNNITETKARKAYVIGVSGKTTPSLMSGLSFLQSMKSSIPW